MTKTLRTKIVSWCAIVASIATITGVYLASGAPTVASDRDITELDGKITQVRQLAEANRLRMLYDDLKILIVKFDIATIENNQPMVSDLKIQIIDKRAEIKVEEEKKAG